MRLKTPDKGKAARVVGRTTGVIRDWGKSCPLGGGSSLNMLRLHGQTSLFASVMIDCFSGNLNSRLVQMYLQIKVMTNGLLSQILPLLSLPAAQGSLAMLVPRFVRKPLRARQMLQAVLFKRLGGSSADAAGR